MKTNHNLALRLGLTQVEAAAILKVTPRTLQRWTKESYGPQPARDGNRLLYDPVDVEAFALGAIA